MGITIQNTTGGSTVFSVDGTTGAVQGASLDTTSSSVLAIGATNASRVQIGSNTTDATAKVFVLDSYNNGTDPTGYNGAMYYNTNTSKFRCYENGAWSNCTASSSNVIQNQNAAQQASSNFWISGTGRADTSLLTPLVDTATEVEIECDPIIRDVVNRDLLQAFLWNQNKGTDELRKNRPFHLSTLRRKNRLTALGHINDGSLGAPFQPSIKALARCFTFGRSSL
jgi:hypothetical protein